MSQSHKLLTIITPLLERVWAEDVQAVTLDDGEEVHATVYGLHYKFIFGRNVANEGEESIIVFRGEDESETSYFLVGEVERIDHINMPYLQVIHSASGGKHDERYASLTERGSLAEHRASDMALRLHLIMEGDIYLSTELVSYIGAGTQRSSNLYLARGS